MSMFGRVVRVIVAARRSVVVAAVVAGASWPACAQDPRQNEPGQFDFYVLSLSWSPSFCAAAHERSPDRSAGPECGPRSYSFVVHGLWPQYEKGFPEFCQIPSPRLDRNIVSSMLDQMPAPRLIFNEWDRHGTCSGLTPRAYFETVRKVRAVVKIPPEFIEPEAVRTVTPGEIEAAFVKANPGLTPGGIAVTCDSKRLNEVRVCFSKDLHFRDCGEVDRRGVCRREQVVMPPVRGGQRPRANAGALNARAARRIATMS
jgi:ribonuclease T2